MSENKFIIVELNDGLKMLVETETDYFLPIYNIEALCILLNYILKNNSLPKMSVKWWEKEEFEEYLEYDFDRRGC